MRALALLLWALLAPLGAQAQGAASLLADSLFVNASGQLVAQGNVEVFYEGARLSASRITFDSASDRLIIEGPLFILAADGTLFEAEAATLDPQLSNGILQGARLVLDQQLQLAANQIDRVEGRYTQLYKVAATSCAICGDRPPLWEIRAERVVHDDEARQMWFENATFRFRGTPILWIPRLRMPDPSQDRATGLMLPQLRTTDQLGLGLKLPYFIKLGDSRDLTLTPYVSSETTTLELDYRQTYLNGDLEVSGAVSNDTIGPTDTARAYLFAEGNFALGNGYQLSFGVETTSDDAYLVDYGYSDKDRLTSFISLERVRADTMFQTELAYVESLRVGESDASLPPYLFSAFQTKRIYPAWLGGALDLRSEFDGFVRSSDVPGDTGRDLGQFGLGAHWSNSQVFGPGLVLGYGAGLDIDYYAVGQDPAYPDDVLRSVPFVQSELRWPLIRQSARGTHVIEPVVALAWSDVHGGAVPNEDSTRAEFDPGNLLALSRFAGDDVVETGTRMALGLTWTRIGAGDLSHSLSFGKVFRTEDPGFSESSGLSGLEPKWLIAGQLKLADGLSIDARTVISDDTLLSKTEARIGWTNDRVDLAATYLHLPVDPDEDRTDRVSEWTLEGGYRINPQWRVTFEGRYDLATDEPVLAGIGFEWQNECVSLDLSVSHRFTSSITVEPSTDFELSIGLSGFSAGQSGSAAIRHCTN